MTFTLGNGLSFTTFVNVVPINEHKTINRFCLVRKLGWDVTGIFNWSAWDKYVDGWGSARALMGPVSIYTHLVSPPGLRSVQ